MKLTQTQSPIDVHILTGFLGSGKTTLLRRLLAEETYGDTAVLVNEFGEVGLDQVLIGEIAPDVLLLNSGCLCCTLRGELKDALADMLNRRTNGDIPAFKRLIVETTGLAKPALILSTVFADPMIRHHYTIGTIVTTVDCLHSALKENAPSEWLEQIAAADTLVLTKHTLTSPEQVQLVHHALDTLNPSAEQLLSDELCLQSLFSKSAEASPALSSVSTMAKISGNFTRLGTSPQSGTINEAIGQGAYLSYKNIHQNDAQTLLIKEATPLDWEAFGVWLSMLLHTHGDQLLRVKGIVNIQGNDSPVVIQGVQHVMYPPEHLNSWNGHSPSTELVFICKGLSLAKIKRSFDIFVLKKK